MKLNFDGTSKGNPGLVGYGGLVRDQEHNLLQIYVIYCGISSNNKEDFPTLERGLKLVVLVSYSKLQIDGDSSLVIKTS